MSKDEILELVLTNVVIHQSDGFQQGYGAAITDIIDNMIDYTKGSDDELTSDFLYSLVDMGESLAKRKRVAEENLAEAKKRGYIDNYVWRSKETFASAKLFVKDSDKLEGKEAGLMPLCGADIEGKDYRICAKCSAIVEDGDWRAHYCPNCGTKVNWGDENEEEKHEI